MKRKGIILAGGSGTRLYPLTLAVSKQLMPVYDKPMIYYPLSVLMLAGIREILIISTPARSAAIPAAFRRRRQFGLTFPTPSSPGRRVWRRPFSSARNFSPDSPACLVLGDNLFYGHDFRRRSTRARTRTEGATIFGYHVSNPEAYGVVEFDAKGKRDFAGGKTPAAKIEVRRARLVFLRRTRWWAWRAA